MAKDAKEGRTGSQLLDQLEKAKGWFRQTGILSKDSVLTGSLNPKP